MDEKGGNLFRKLCRAAQPESRSEALEKILVSGFMPIPERIPIPLKLTPAQEERIRELFKLIADEKDSEKVQVLAGELARLLTVQAPLRKPSDQQLRIIELVAQGLKNREIADEIGLSRNVVRNYVGQIYREVGVRNRVELALWYEARVHEGKLRRP
jgi:DNA-binding CsgD family transcriptional regulator